MINYKVNKRFRDLDSLNVPTLQAKKAQIKTKDIIAHNSQLQNTELSYNATRYARRNDILLPKNHFRSKLISYLEQNEQHLKQATQQGEKQRLNTSNEWIKINKQYSQVCKNQSHQTLPQRNYRRKNIKQYISETALAKRKKVIFKPKNSSDEETSQQLKSKAFKSLLVTNKWNRRDTPYTGSDDGNHKFIPIHHSQIYFCQKQYKKRSNRLYSNQSQHHSISFDQQNNIQDQQKNLRATEPLLNGQRRVHSPVKILLEADEQEAILSKFLPRGKRENRIIFSRKPKSRLFVSRPTKTIPKNEQEMEISPWKRRKTLYTQLSDREFQLFLCIFRHPPLTFSLLKLTLIIILMLIDHPFIPAKLKEFKRPAVVSQQKPFIVITNQRFSLLTRTIQSVFRHYGYAYSLKDADSHQLMERTLPILCFEDIILQKQALVQFLCQICLTECSLPEFVDRKQNMKKMYSEWWSILYNELNLVPASLDFQDLRKNDHINKIFEQMINFASMVVGKGYERLFRSYKADQFNIESVFLVDVTQTILEQLPRHQTDYILRGYFTRQIDYYNNYKQLLEREVRNDQPLRKVVLIDGPVPAEKVHPKLNYNWKWFGGIATAMTLAFLKWGK